MEVFSLRKIDIEMKDLVLKFKRFQKEEYGYVRYSVSWHQVRENGQKEILYSVDSYTRGGFMIKTVVPQAIRSDVITFVLKKMEV